MYYKLKPGFKSLNGFVEILDEDKLAYKVKNSNRGSIGIRTISKDLLREYVTYFEKYPESSPQEARDFLSGKSNIDKFEYGYTSTLTTIAKMVLGSELSDTDKKFTSNDQPYYGNHTGPLQVIYYGAPGTGKSYQIDQLTTQENSVRTTFHPDSDYASFVGAYKPTMEEVDIHYISDGEVKYAAGADNDKAKKGKHNGKEKKIVYKYVPQAFLKAYVEAWKRYADGNKSPYYLVIEEINRGNCAQIFGDLFQLLDRNNSGSSSYAISADEDIAQFLREDVKGFSECKDENGEGLTEEQRNVIKEYIHKKDNGKEEHIGQAILNGSKLLLPPNLHIWATMNTSDQSLFPIDSAFKRRWDWEYMPIEYSPKDSKTKIPLNWKLKIGDNLYDWGKFLSTINPEIETLTESSDKQMGYFFVKANPLTGIISEEVFKNKVLFYLWTEVLKDFDMGKDPFINPETKKTFKFTDFFDSNQNAVVNFIENLRLLPSDSENRYDMEDNSEMRMLNLDESAVKSSINSYKVNGEIINNKNAIPTKAIELYIKNNPSKTVDDVIKDWKTLDFNWPPHFIENETIHNARKDSAKEYVNQLNCIDGPIFITKDQWGDNRPNGGVFNVLELKKALDKTNWGIIIEGIE